MKSEKDDKDRFLNDIYWGIAVLLNRQVQKDHIDIILDPVTEPLNPTVKDMFSTLTIHDTSKCFEVINLKQDLENLIIVFTGHGSIYGLDSDNSIKPNKLIEIIHNSNKKNVALIFGQCFAGIYNYTNVINKNKDQSVCIIGASHLNSSVSSSCSMTVGTTNIVWTANIFLFHFFNWILSPTDIDGDGNASLVDAFKFSGGQSSSHLLNEKKTSYIQLYNLSKRLDELKKQKVRMNSSKRKKQEANTKLEIKSIETTIMEYTGVNHVIQDPWILNANKAREFIFSI
ncbi:MAG: hypothetical protein Q7T91_05215 [Sulfuricurvum sp.]|nr:hypothetical protein [Sulfuricurvum sp.]